MKQPVSSDFKLGIISGGQLGKMLAQAASEWDVAIHIMENSPDCPAAPVANSFTLGDRLNYDDVLAFGRSVDMLTLEIEHVNIDALRQLKAEGKTVHPDPDALAIIQDKGLQKQFYADHGIPTSPWKTYDDEHGIRNAVAAGELQIPFVQKTRAAGYDGNGVMVVKHEEDLRNLLSGPSIAEEAVDIQKEIAVIVARNTKGELISYPSVEMEFNPTANLVERLICPADISDELEKQAEDLAMKVIGQFETAGVLAVEMFLTGSGELLVNEVAPRPHNSGHHTIESVVTSQYEQHLRAILSWPLGSTKIVMPAVMINLLGEPDHTGPVKYDGFDESMGIEGVNIHIYGKKETRPFRKMGHVTVIAPTLEDARSRAVQVKELLKVRSWNSQS